MWPTTPTSADLTIMKSKGNRASVLGWMLMVFLTIRLRVGEGLCDPSKSTILRNKILNSSNSGWWIRSTTIRMLQMVAISISILEVWVKTFSKTGVRVSKTEFLQMAIRVEWIVRNGDSWVKFNPSRNSLIMPVALARHKTLVLMRSTIVRSAHGHP